MSAESDRKRNEFRDSLRRFLLESRALGVPEGEIASLGDRIERAAAETKEGDLAIQEGMLRQEIAAARTQAQARAAQTTQETQAREQKAQVGKEIDLQGALTGIVGEFGSLTPQETALAITRISTGQPAGKTPEQFRADIIGELGSVREKQRTAERARVEEEFGKFSAALASEEDIANRIRERTTAGFAGSPLLQSGAFQSALAQGTREAAARRSGTLAQARGGLEQGLTAQQLAGFRGSEESEQARAIGARAFPFQAARETRELELGPFQTALAGSIRQEDYMARQIDQIMKNKALSLASKRSLIDKILSPLATVAGAVVPFLNIGGGGKPKIGENERWG